MVYRVVFLLIFGSMSFGTHGADIFKWVDEKGRTHYGESVPDKFKRKATTFDRKGVEPTDAQRQEAETRLANDRAIAESIEARKAKLNKPPAKSPTLPLTAGKDDKVSSCETETKKYTDSLACFAPYRNATGGIKAEAFQHCVEVKQPKC